MATIKRLSKREIKTMLSGKKDSVINDIITYHASKAAESQAIVALARKELKQRSRAATEVNNETSELKGINSGFVSDYAVKSSDSDNVG